MTAVKEILEQGESKEYGNSTVLDVQQWSFTELGRCMGLASIHITKDAFGDCTEILVFDHAGRSKIRLNLTAAQCTELAAALLYRSENDDGE